MMVLCFIIAEKCCFLVAFVKSNAMNPIEIRTNFNDLIDKINNDQLLIKLYHIMEQASSTADGQSPKFLL